FAEKYKSVTFALAFEYAFNTVVVAQLVRASDCGSEGRRFETDLPPKKHKPFNNIIERLFLCYKFCERDRWFLFVYLNSIFPVCYFPSGIKNQLGTFRK